jgi:hydroxyacylglutathione hydrolase
MIENMNKQSREHRLRLLKKKEWYQLVVLILLSAVSAILFNSFSGDSLRLSYQPPQISAGSMLTLEEALPMYKRREAVFIDARKESEYQSGHISQAINIPHNGARTFKMEQFARLDKKQNIIVYCESASCATAERLCAEMQFIGFEQVAVLVDGFEAWPTDLVEKDKTP